MLVRAVAISRQRLQTEAIGRLESDGNSCSHAPDSHAFRPTGNPLRDSNVRRDPLAARTGLAKRYVREWALAQASNGYIAFHSATDQFSLTPEQAMVFAIKDSPV